jgi:hypothetical protein
VGEEKEAEGEAERQGEEERGERVRQRERTCRYSVYLLLIRILKSLLGMIFLVLIPFC